MGKKKLRYSVQESLKNYEVSSCGAEANFFIFLFIFFFLLEGLGLEASYKVLRTHEALVNF